MRAGAGERSPAGSRSPATASSAASTARSRRSSRSSSIAARSPASTRQAWELFHDFDVLRQLEAEHAAGLDPALGGPAAVRAQSLLQPLVGRRPADLGRRARVLTGLYEHRNGSYGHERLRHRPRAHRHAPGSGRSPRRTASACAPSARRRAYMDDYPEYRFACSQAQQYTWIKERNPDLYARIRERVERGPVRARRRHLDRARLQHPVRRVARAPVPARPGVLRARVRPPLPRVLEPRRVRLQRPAAADHARRGHRPLPHAEALVEPRSTSPTTTRSAGRASTAARC